MTDWRNRITGAGEQPASLFVGNPLNWRVHPQEQQAALSATLDQIGWIQNVIVNSRTGRLLDGHARVLLALQAGDLPVPYTTVDLSETEEALALATLDPLGALARTNAGAYETLLKIVGEDAANLTAITAEAQRDVWKVPFAHMSTPAPTAVPFDAAAPDPAAVDDQADADQAPRAVQSTPAQPAARTPQPPAVFPLAVLLSRIELTRWQQWKEVCDTASDKAALFAALDLAEAQQHHDA